MLNNLQIKLQSLKEKNLYRQLKITDSIDAIHVKQNGKKYISFCSNDYLGLAQNKLVKNAAIAAIKKYGFGAGASRYVTGNNSLYEKLENKLSKLKKVDNTIIFGSGYLTGIGIIPALVEDGDLIIADKLIHSSLLDGCKLSGAKLMRFRHNEINHAQEILNKERKNFKKCLIITETVFSMDGDLGRINELLELAENFESFLLSDDAHGIGIIKQKFKKSDLHIQAGTLSKAVGGYGGYVCASKLIIDYLRNFAKSAIYSTALPPAVLAGNLKALEIISRDKKLGKKALENANYFCNLLKLPKAESTIIPILIGDAAKSLTISKKIKDQGFLISAIRPPTVEPRKSRLRVTFSALHKKTDICNLAKIIIEALMSEHKNIDPTLGSYGKFPIYEQK